MPKGGGIQVDETVALTGTSAAFALDRVAIALRDLDQHQVVRQSPSVLQIARSDRGLLGRKQAVCVLSAATEPQRVLVSIFGDVLPVVAETIRGALQGSNSRPSPAMTFSPTYQPTADSTPFVPPHDWFLAPYEATDVAKAPSIPLSSPPLPTHAGRFEPAAPLPPPDATLARPSSDPAVHLPDGRVLTLRGDVIVGRTPTARPSDTAAVCIAINDDELSKTHCMFGVESVNGDLLAWVEDLHSTNGSAVAAPGRPAVVVEPGSRVYAKLPATIVIGASRLVIQIQSGGSS